MSAARSERHAGGSRLQSARGSKRAAGGVQGAPSSSILQGRAARGERRVAPKGMRSGARLLMARGSN